MLSLVEKWWSIRNWKAFESFVCSRKSTKLKLLTTWSPDRFGRGMYARSSCCIVGEIRLAGTWLPGNGSRTTTPFTTRVV